MATQSKKNDIPVTGINQNGTTTVYGVHFGNTPDLKILTGNSDSHLFDKSRLAHTKDNRLTRRIYFYEKSGDTMPPTDGHGEYAYIAGLNGIYNPDTAQDSVKEEIGELMADNSTNEWESAILDAGYYGYVANGVIVFLDGKVKARYLGNTKSVEAQSESPTSTPTDLPVAPTNNASGSKPLPTPRKPRKPKSVPTVSPIPEKSTVEAVDDSQTPSGGVSDVGDSSSDDIMENIKKVFLSEEFTKNLAGKIAVALTDFNRSVRDFELSHDEEKHTNVEKTNDVPKKDDTDKVTKLLEEIRQILKAMKNGSQKDISKGQQRLEEIMQETSSFSSETHEFFQKSVNKILKEINTGVVEKKQENPKPLKQPATIIPNVTSLPTGIVPTSTPTDFAGKPVEPVPTKEEHKDEVQKEPSKSNTKSEVSQTSAQRENVKVLVPQSKEQPTFKKDSTPPIEENEKKDFTGKPVEPVPTKEEHKDEATKEQPTKKPRVPRKKEDAPKPQLNKVEYIGPKKAPKSQKARIEKDSAGNLVQYRPAYKSLPQNLSGLDAVVGSILNKNKNVVTRGADGSYTKTLGANRIGYAKKIFRSVDKYVGDGETARGLRKLGVMGSRGKPTPVKPSDVPKNVQMGSPLMAVDKPIVGQTTQAVPDVPEKDSEEKQNPSNGKPNTLWENIKDIAKPGAIAAALTKGKAMISTAGKVAAPLAAAYSVGEGAVDEYKGKKVENLTDIIPEGTINKINPFSYAMNAGRYVGNLQNKYYGAVSKTLGGSGSLGSDIYGMFNDDPMVTKVEPTKAKPSNVPTPKTAVSEFQVPNEKQFKPSPKSEYVNNNDYLTEKAMDKDSSLNKDVVTAPQTITNNNTTNNPVTQVMPNNPMTLRPMESAYTRQVDRAYSR